MDQGQTYLNLVLDHKADVLLEYITKTGKTIDKKNVDWGQTRVMFIGPKFSTYQKRALSPNLPFELWEVGIYEGGLIEYDQINPIGGDKKFEKKSSSSLTGTAAKEIVTYTVEDHLRKSSKNIQDLFQELREQIFGLDSKVQEKPVGNYIGYKISWYNFVAIHFFKEKLRITVRKEVINDKEKRFTKIPASYAWGKTPLWWVEISNPKDLNYVFPIVKESYDAAPDK
jgi:predicted transport protein